MKKCLLILPLAAILLLLVQNTAYAQSWKTYPYQPAGSLITFPADEGHHANEPMEWWYTVAHLTGDSTGTPYSVMLTYFDYPAGGFDGFRIFNMANDSTGEFYPETQPVNYGQLADSGLFITANVFGQQQEQWHTKTDSAGQFIPFEYSVNAYSANGSIELNYDAVKRPLIVGDSGYFYQGQGDYTYYYSQTRLDVSGVLTLGGLSETVSGIAWIDRQYGEFNPNTGEEYEWFCLQLSNDMDINLWNIFDTDSEIPDVPEYRLMAAYVDDSTQFTVADFTLERLAYAYQPDSARVYSRKWRLTADTMDIDLTIETLHNDHEVKVPFRFFEGATKISGTVNGKTVEGKGFAELLHDYTDPGIVITAPDNAITGPDSVAITWQLQNQDDGRPVVYDLWAKPYATASYQLLAENLTDTFYYWNVGAGDSASYLKVVAHTTDSTLAGKVEKQLTLTGGNAMKSLQHRTKVYPNPASSVLNIRLPDEPQQSVDVRLFDETGKLVRSRQFLPRQRLSFSLEGIANGLYLLEICTDSGTVQKKISKWQ